MLAYKVNLFPIELEIHPVSESIMKAKDIARDFMHLSQELVVSREPILYELVAILENCQDADTNPETSDYQKNAIINLIALAQQNNKILQDLENIAENRIGLFNSIQNLAKQILKQAQDFKKTGSFSSTDKYEFQNNNPSKSSKLQGCTFSKLSQSCKGSSPIYGNAHSLDSTGPEKEELLELPGNTSHISA